MSSGRVMGEEDAGCVRRGCHSAICYSAARTGLEIVTPCEVSWTEKEEYYRISFICGI